MHPDTQLRLILTAAQLDMAVRALRRLSYDEAAPVIDAIRAQVAAQIQPPAPADEATGAR